jgi:hypothetical protein
MVFESSNDIDRELVIMDIKNWLNAHLPVAVGVARHGCLRAI